MATKKKMLQAAAGNAGGEALDITDVFSTYLYESAGTTQTITNDIDLSGEGGMVWFKRRNLTSNHRVYDTERGMTSGTATPYLYTNGNAGNLGTGYSDSVVATSTGFDITSTGIGDISDNGGTYASWTFRKAPKFFDVVTYTGTSAVQNISHNLGSVPGMIIVKCTNTAKNWGVYHRSAGSTDYLQLNTTDGANANSGFWNNTDPTSTQFTLGTQSNVNGNGNTYVAYLFAHNDGDGEFGPDGDQDIIKCGSYTGAGTVNLGFEPQWVLYKRTESTGPWYLQDTMRGLAVDGADQAFSYPNNSDADGVGTGDLITPTSTGFNHINAGDYIYIAIRRGPLAPPESGTEVFAPVATGQTNNPQSGFPVDLWWLKARNGPELHVIMDRMRGTGKYLSSDSKAAEGTNPSDYYRIDNMTGGFSNGGSYSQYIHWMWKRAPGFCDVVAYTGTGLTHTINHNLGVAPEMIWVKSRDSSSENWVVFHEGAGTLNNTFFPLLFLNSSAAATLDEDFTSQGMPTATSFTLNGADRVNTYLGHDYIAYLFASLDGISKVGSYTGTGATLNIDCGFTSGARFVLIKRTDNQSPWWVWDSERGIIAGNDPWLELNSTAAEVTNTDYIDPYSAGFTLTSGGNWLYGMNYPSGEYIFYAIA